MQISLRLYLSRFGNEKDNNNAITADAAAAAAAATTTTQWRTEGGLGCSNTPEIPKF
jgi:hypothetical protein